MSVGSFPASVTGLPLMRGPSLEALLHALARAPLELSESSTSVNVLISDFLFDLTGTALSSADVDLLGDMSASTRLPGQNWAQESHEISGLVWWLARLPEVLPYLPDVSQACGGAVLWFEAVRFALMEQLAPLRAADQWRDVGREEFARAFLAVGGWLPAGESGAVALDSWLAVSTQHQRELYAALVKEREAAKAFAAALADRKAKEAAANYANY